MISTGMQGAFSVSMISFCRTPYMLVLPCLRLLLQEVVHHDAAHAETLGIYYQFWIFQRLMENSVFAFMAVKTPEIMLYLWQTRTTDVSLFRSKVSSIKAFTFLKYSPVQ